MRQFMPVLISVLLLCGCESERDSRVPAQVTPTPTSTSPTVASVVATPPAVVIPPPAVTSPTVAAAVPTVAVPALAQAVIVPPPAGPPATFARTGVGEPHWLAPAGWKSGAAEHSNPAQVRVLTEADGAGARAVEVAVTGGTKDKAVVFHALAKEDIAAHPGLAFTVSNHGEQPMHLAIAVKTGKGWLYHESTVCVIPAKTAAPIPLSYDLESSVFRTLATKWQPTSTIADLGELREVQVVILNGNQAGAAVIADVQIMEQVAK